MTKKEDDMASTDVSQTVADIRRYYNSGDTRSVSFRIQQLRKLKSMIRSHEDEIIQALYNDLKKPPFESYASEIGIMYVEIEHAIRHIKSWSHPRRVATPIIHFLSSSRIYQEPYGVVLIMGPWNYPFNLLIAPLVGAMAAGNCVVIKPSEFASNMSKTFSGLISKYFHTDYICAVEGGVEISQQLLAEKFDYIFYTGSTAVGRVVMEAAARNLTPVTLELGGKSPCIVDEDASLDYAVKRIAWGKFFNAGQTCIAPDYCLVHSAIKDVFLEKMKKTIQDFYGDDPMQSPDYARIVNEKHFQRLTRLLGDGNIIAGGKTDATNLYIAPTLIDRVSLQDGIMQEEIFGPLLPIITFDRLEQAIDMVNRLPRSLALYFFSNNAHNQQEILTKTSYGGGCINDTISHIGSLTLPFGGIGDSGMGAYHGKTSFDTFSHSKSILTRSNLIDMPLRYPPYGNKVTFLKWLFRVIG
jgi:acyl-CoA reductase-like NAD-dependent aldehyde dehydrogenase